MPTYPAATTNPHRPGRDRDEDRRPSGHRAGGRSRRRPDRRSGPKRALTVTAVAAASALAVGTGVALDRLVLPELRSEPVSAGRAAPENAPPPPGTDLGARPDAVDAAPVPSPSESAPPLKPLPGGTKGATPRPEASKSASPGGASSGGGTPRVGGATVAETTVVTLTNKERAKEGCSPLRIDEKLMLAAQRHSADMAAHNYFDHTSRNGDSPWDRMEAAGYSQPGAENIAKGYATPAAVVQGWMNSPGHRANILNCKLRAIGVGMAQGPGGPYWTQNFGWV
ncbi:CAP domain-containing protein [Actinomadura sp. SCN-SB]|uniref:CAP domain-containing protein n=1 Tax=Actinomadura sp. SCN-SB TaxID=3373092 RepID=UPI0037504BB8